MKRASSSIVSSLFVPPGVCVFLSVIIKSMDSVCHGNFFHLQREVVKMKFVGTSDEEDVVNCERGVSRTLSLCLSHLIKVARVRKHTPK
jgi:hypothetical protein